MKKVLFRTISACDGCPFNEPDNFYRPNYCNLKPELDWNHEEECGVHDGCPMRENIVIVGLSEEVEK